MLAVPRPFLYYIFNQTAAQLPPNDEPLKNTVHQPTSEAFVTKSQKPTSESPGTLISTEKSLQEAFVTNSECNRSILVWRRIF